MLKRLPLLVIALLVATAAGNFIVRDFLASSLVAFGEDGASRDMPCSIRRQTLQSWPRVKYLIYRAEPPRPEEGDFRASARHSAFTPGLSFLAGTRQGI
ncbi:MAG: hypothetical protein IPG76_21660 [Acidobacteria bacterium]|nr:hypothetical protein [Acidobacteriota bacterium]